MSEPSSAALEAYLAWLRTELRKRGVLESRFVEETRGHLSDAIDAGVRGGQTFGTASDEAMARFGDPRVVAARFAAEKDRTLHSVLLGVALGLGLAIAWIDSRPHWDDAGITAGMLLLSSGMLGLMGPRRPWLWGLGIGAWVPMWMPARIFVQTHTVMFDPLLACFSLGVCIAGAHAGMALRKLMVRLTQPQV